MGESLVGLRCPGDLTDLQCATSREQGGCIRSVRWSTSPQEEHGGGGREMSNSNTETLPGHWGRGDQNLSGSCHRTGGAFTSTTSEGSNQTGTNNWGKKKKEWNSRELQDSFIPNIGKKMEQNLLDSISRITKDKNAFANGKENFPKAKCAKSTQLLMMKPLALWMKAVQETQFPWLQQAFWHSPALALLQSKRHRQDSRKSGWYDTQHSSKQVEV